MTKYLMVGNTGEPVPLDQALQMTGILKDAGVNERSLLGRGDVNVLRVMDVLDDRMRNNAN